MTTHTKKNYSIIIVDDDEFLLDMYTLKFKEAGCEVEGMTDSTKVLDRLRTGGCPDALLLDLVMPGLDGLSLLKLVREEKLCKATTAVIILSNQGQDTDIDAAQAQGIDGYLIKASTIPSEVLSNVLQTIEKKQRA